MLFDVAIFSHDSFKIYPQAGWPASCNTGLNSHLGRQSQPCYRASPAHVIGPLVLFSKMQISSRYFVKLIRDGFLSNCCTRE